MSEYERGAYTPYTDEDELEFDARQPRGQRRPMPVALITSAVVLVALAGAVVLAYRSGVRAPGEPPRAVGQPVLAVKTAGPNDAVQPTDPAAGLDVYDAQDKGAPNTTAASTAPPAFAPAPEEPAVQRDLPSTGNTAVAEDPDLATVPGAAQPTKPVPPAPPAKPKAVASTAAAPTVSNPEPAPVKIARADTTVPKTVHAQASAARSVKPETAARTAEAHAKAAPTETKPAAAAKAPAASGAHGGKLAANDKAAAVKASAKTEHGAKAAETAEGSAGKAADKSVQAEAGHSGVVVQIGAFASADLADKGWSSVAAAMPAGMAGKSKRVQKVEVNGKTFYRSFVAGFSSRADAQSFCQALAAKGRGCLVKR